MQINQIKKLQAYENFDTSILLIKKLIKELMGSEMIRIDFMKKI